MKYLKQEFLHKPEVGQYGDCYRTCVACILDLDRDNVPHFMDGDPPVDTFNARIDDFLRGHGLRRFKVGFTCDLEGLLNWMKLANPDIFYFIAGTSPRGSNHQTIAFNDRIIHDPHPEGGGLVAPCDDDTYWIDVFIPIAIHAPGIAA